MGRTGRPDEGRMADSILVAEDERASGEYLKLLLEEMGVRIEAARGMRAAVLDLLDESAGAPPSRGLEVENCTVVRAAVRAALRSTDHTKRGWQPVPGVGAAAGCSRCWRWRRRSLRCGSGLRP